MRIVTRTVIGDMLQAQQFVRIPFTPVASTTLNEKFNIFADALPQANVWPALNYFAIGVGGRALTAGVEGIIKTVPVPHRATDTALYRQIPFILRRETQDLTAEQRANYALRREETHNGIRYYAYYLKRFDKTNLTSNLWRTSKVNGVDTTVPFTPNNSNLNPTPPELPVSGQVQNLTSGDFVSVSILTNISLTPFDVAELIEVSKVLFGSEDYAVISEIALVSGTDRIVTVDGTGGVQISFNEAVHTQVTTFISADNSLTNASSGLDLIIDVGATESLLTHV